MQSYLDASREVVKNQWRDLKPNPRSLRNDAMAGFTFAAVNIPQGLAYALMAGINPVNGLYTLMVATPIAALLTGSALLNVSSTGALSASLADTLNPFASSDKLIVMGLLVVVMGLIQLALGLFKMGWLMRFVPNSVMVGFITAVALNIMIGQLNELTGWSSTQSNQFLKLADTALNYTYINYASLTIGLLTIALIFAFERTPVKSVAMLLALAVTSALVVILGLTNVDTVASVASIPQTLPKPVPLDWHYFRQIIVPAISVGLLGLIQGAAVGQAFPNPDGKYGSLNRDFVGQGIANIAGGFFQGLPAGGSASGTGVIVGAGGASRWANIFAGLFVIVLVMLFGWLVEMVAMPALAGLLIVIGARMINVKAIASVRNTSVVASTSFYLTLTASLLIPLQYAVLFGIAVAVMINLFQQSEQVRVVELVWSDTQFPVEQPVPKTLRSDGVTCLYVHGSLFFAAASNMEKTLPDPDDARNAVILLGLRGHHEVGSTLIAVLERYVRSMQKNGNRLIIVGANKQIRRQLRDTGMTALIGDDSVFGDDKRIGYPLALAYAEAVRWLKARNVDIRRPVGLRMADEGVVLNDDAPDDVEDVAEDDSSDDGPHHLPLDLH